MMIQPAVKTIAKEIERNSVIVAALVLLILAVYYSIGAMSLPYNAGPDEGDSRAAIYFYLEHKRMVVMPQDQDLVKWSYYGTTRTMRPPLPYFSGAAFAWLSKGLANLEVQVRFGSVFGILLMLSSGWLAGALLGVRQWALNISLVAFGLWPQIAFTAMYCNDDAMTWGVCGLIALALALLLRFGLTVSTFLVAAAVGGLVSISKFSAWPWAMVLVLALIVTAVRNTKVLASLKLWIGAIVLFFIFGGWWFAFNMVHYGWNDPLALNALATTAVEHSRISNVDAKGFFHKHDMTMLDVLKSSYFWSQTYINSIGKIGWINAPMGVIVYSLYGILLFCTFVGSLAFIIVRHRIARWAAWTILGLAVSITLYIWFNTYSDIQIQGRYLLPAAPFGLVLMAAFWAELLRRLSILNRRWVVGSVIGLITLTHAHAVSRYAIPHYWQDSFKVTWGKEFRIHFDMPFFIERFEDMRYEWNERGWKLIKEGPDPKVYLRRDICLMFGNNAQILASMESEVSDTFVVYVGDAHGFREENSLHMYYTPQTPTVAGFIALSDCRQVRIDPFLEADEVIVKELIVRPFNIWNR